MSELGRHSADQVAATLTWSRNRAAWFMHLADEALRRLPVVFATRPRHLMAGAPVSGG